MVGFFAIGFIVKETTYTTQVVLNKPLEEVFAAFNDFDQTKNWIPEFKAVEVIDEKLNKVGSTYKITLANNGKEVIMKEKVLTFVPNKHVVLNYSVEGMLKKNDFTFSSEENQTKIIQKSSCKSESHLMRCVFPIFKSKFKAQDQSYLDNFKQYMEKP